jgi:hypothetical protein
VVGADRAAARCPGKQDAVAAFLIGRRSIQRPENTWLLDATQSQLAKLSRLSSSLQINRAKLTPINR